MAAALALLAGWFGALCASARPAGRAARLAAFARLRPLEALVRRWLVIAASEAPAAASRPARPVRPRPGPARRRAPCRAGAVPAFRLVERGLPAGLRPGAACRARITLIGPDAHRPPSPPRPDGLAQRIAALQAVFANPAPAIARMAGRLLARRRVLRPGRPPGHASAHRLAAIAPDRLQALDHEARRRLQCLPP